MENKSWWKSLTIQASALIGLLQAAPAIVAEVDKIYPGDLNADPRVIAGLTAASALVAIYGRIRANTSIGK